MTRIVKSSVHAFPLLHAKTVRLVVAAVLLLVIARKDGSAQELQAGSKFTALGCYAHLKGDLLTIGNSHLRRVWRIADGRLFAVSLFDLDRQIEWIGSTPTLPSPEPPVRSGGAAVTLRGGSGRFGPTEAESLRIELAEATAGTKTLFEFQVFPEASGIRVWLQEEQSGTNPEEVPPASPSGSAPTADALEHLRITEPHIRLSQVILRDRTDERDELVFENEWLLQPNESQLKLQGNIFFVESTLSGDGLLFLKEAPQPEMRPLQTDYDCWVSGSGMAISKTADRKTQPFFNVSFYGNGFNQAGVGYPFALIAYHGGRTGRIAATQRYQRQIREFCPGRDGQLVSNTWGDRSSDSKLSEAFIHQEVDTGKKLGVDIVEVDEGWQSGRAMGMTGGDGVWDGYWESDSTFWTLNVQRFPHGLSGLSDYANGAGIRLGLWFAPDSFHDFANWRKDADQLLAWSSQDHIDAFKLDSVKIRSKEGEANYHALADRVLKHSSGKILLDLDVTAETRQGYFGNIAAGPLFVENRYTDFHRYWPHQTLRNFWKLAQYVDPLRLRMEFLNSERNSELYPNDPLAPRRNRPSCLFAITMFGSPLGWFENSGLSSSFVADVSPVISTWKKEREAVYRGTILPIGEVPDGTSWTGFVSVADDQRGGYLLVFREVNGQSTWTVPPSLFRSGNYRIQVLAGEGKITQTADSFLVDIPNQLGFVWARLGIAQ